MGKRNRKGKENNVTKNGFLKVGKIKNSNPELELPSQEYTSIEEKGSCSPIDIPLITKKPETTKADSTVFDYPTIGDLVSSVEELCILKELEIAFPEVGNTLIKAILIASQGTLEPAFNSLLYYSNPEENTDFALPMKPINVEDLSKVDVREILQCGILDYIENEVSGQEIDGSMMISKIGSERSSLGDLTDNINIPRSNREIAESTRNMAVAEEHSVNLSREASAHKGEEKGVSSLKGAAVKVATKSLKRNRIPVTVKKNGPSNNLFDVLNCDESEEEEEQNIETDASDQGKKSQGGNTEVPKTSKTGDNAQRDSTNKLPTNDDSGYKSAFGTDSCGLFAADGKDEKQVHPPRKQELSFT
ncbi:Don1p [Saccharomyces paradoxus]|uniref:Don1p n=1 Tax=Saccharomyces paradoxus TaxID=27291 RepID=A0A8B8UNZ0_SACPA|nr:Don1 [Saccharomyces paradoxus]QHS72468.1 Don1 [Saccharomyces paradoxus]